MRDLAAWWTSDAWRAAAEAWVHDSLDRHGICVIGPIEQPRVRFWSTQLTVPTSDGRYWFKENNPAQAFEAGLLQVLGRVAPHRVMAPIAIEPDRGWLLTRDAGPTLREDHAGERVSWPDIVAEFAAFQRELVPFRDELLATGLSPHPASETVAAVIAEVEHLRALPPDHPLRLAPAPARHILAGIPRLREAADTLSSLPVDNSLQHNDLHDGNVFSPSSGPLRFFDLGDALWAHPFASLSVPLDILHRRGSRAEVARVQDAYLEVFADLHPRADLVRVLAAARRLGAWHRYLSWRRLLDTVPVAAATEWAEPTLGWLTRATAVDVQPRP